MRITIKCLECGRKTREFEIGEVFYKPKKPLTSIIVKESVFCPKCKKDLSKEKFTVSKNDILLSFIAVDVCLISQAKSPHGLKIPEHLQGIRPLTNSQLKKIKPYCKSKPKLVDKL